MPGLNTLNILELNCRPNFHDEIISVYSFIRRSFEKIIGNILNTKQSLKGQNYMAIGLPDSIESFDSVFLVDILNLLIKIKKDGDEEKGDEENGELDISYIFLPLNNRVDDLMNLKSPILNDSRMETMKHVKEFASKMQNWLQEALKLIGKDSVKVVREDQLKEFNLYGEFYDQIIDYFNTELLKYNNSGFKNETIKILDGLYTTLSKTQRQKRGLSESTTFSDIKRDSVDQFKAFQAMRYAIGEVVLTMILGGQKVGHKKEDGYDRVAQMLTDILPLEFIRRYDINFSTSVTSSASGIKKTIPYSMIHGSIIGQTTHKNIPLTFDIYGLMAELGKDFNTTGESWNKKKEDLNKVCKIMYEVLCLIDKKNNSNDLEGIQKDVPRDKDEFRIYFEHLYLQLVNKLIFPLLLKEKNVKEFRFKDRRYYAEIWLNSFFSSFNKIVNKDFDSYIKPIIQDYLPTEKKDSKFTNESTKRLTFKGNDKEYNYSLYELRIVVEALKVHLSKAINDSSYQRHNAEISQKNIEILASLIEQIIVFLRYNDKRDKCEKLNPNYNITEAN